MNKKICPLLLSVTPREMDCTCFKDCAWYDVETRRCILIGIKENLYYIGKYIKEQNKKY